MNPTFPNSFGRSAPSPEAMFSLLIAGGYIARDENGELTVTPAGYRLAQVLDSHHGGLVLPGGPIA